MPLRSQLQGSSWKVISKSFSHYFHSIPGTGGGVELRSSIFHVFDKFRDILFLAARVSRFLTSASTVSEFLLTGTLILTSSAYFKIPLFESTSFISFTIRENNSGPRTLWHSSVNINIISNFSIHDPLFAVAKEANNPGDDIWIKISSL